MAVLENLTPYGAFAQPTVTGSGLEGLLVCVAAHFDLPRPGAAPRDPLLRADDQPAPPLTDEYWGDPTCSSLKQEGQTAPVRPGTDITVTGQAWAPGGRPTKEWTVRVTVGPCTQRAAIFGPRRWERRRTGLFGTGAPAPVRSVPLRWELAFGGTLETPPEGSDGPTSEPRNPVGRGLYRDAAAADGRPLPQIEHLTQRISQLRDRPLPVGFGPVARHWQPRCQWAGTYDQQWIENRAPGCPDDFDERFFLSAPVELQAIPHLSGGEPVVLEGLDPAGPLLFALPRLRLGLRAQLGSRISKHPLRLDGVQLQTDKRKLTLVYRTLVAAPRGVLELKGSRLRELENWEEGW